MQASMQASVAKMPITAQEALTWFKLAFCRIKGVTPRLSNDQQELESIRQGVDAFAAYTKVSSMMDAYSPAEQHLIESMRQNMNKLEHTWTDERARIFKRSVLQASWLRITAGRMQTQKHNLLMHNPCLL